MTKKFDCLYIMLGYNERKVTLDSLLRLRKYVPKKSIVLIDNGSKPNLKEISKKADVNYYRFEENLGFSESYNKYINKIISKVNFDFFCLINSDLLVNKKMIEAVNEKLSYWNKNKHLAIVQPISYLDSDYKQIENAGINYYWSGLAFQNKNIKQTNNVLINGACLFIKKTVVIELFNKYGYLLNPKFFFNAEDIELSLRIISLGYLMKVDPDLKVQHLHSQTVGKKSSFSYSMSIRNLFWTILITRSFFEILISLPFIIIGRLFLSLFAIKNKMYSAIFFTTIDTIRNFRSIMKLRKVFFINKETSIRKYWKGYIIQNEIFKKSV